MSSVKYLQELGPNLKNIVKRLLANQNLLKLLWYTDKDPLNSDKVEITSQQAYGHGNDSIIRIVPIIGYKEDPKSIITIKVLKGDSLNSDYIELYLSLEIFVPIEQWVIKGDNLRPYAIMGEIQKSLNGKEINGLGKINCDNFYINFLTEEMSAYAMDFTITQMM